jgi:tetratricopeptide (TPR) repeat protein
MPEEHVAVNVVTRWADIVARISLIALLGLFPFFVAPLAWVTVPQSKVLFALAILVFALFAWLIARIVDGAVHIPRSALLYAGAFLPIAYLISTAFTDWSRQAIVGHGVEQDTLVSITIWYALFALVSIILYGNRTLVRQATRSLTVGLTILLGFSVAYVFFPAELSLGGLLRATTSNLFGTWHDIGVLAGLSLFLAFAMYLSRIFTGMWRIVPVVLGLLSVFMLVVIHFQDIFIGTAVLMLAGAIAVFRSAHGADGVSMRQAALRVVPWLVAAIAFGGLAVYSTSIVTMLPQKLKIEEVEVRPSWQGTFEVARQSLDAPSALLFGSGPNSFIRAWGQHKPASINLTPFWNTDFNYGIGVIPTSIFAVGLFGLVAWGAMLLIVLGLLLRFVREVRPLSTSRVLFGTSLLASIYLIGFHLIYTPGVAVTGFTFLMLGVLVATASEAQQRVVRTGISSVSGMLALIALVVVAAIVFFAALYGGREVLSNAYINKAVFAYDAGQDVAAARSAVNQALAISPRNERAHRAAAELGIIELAALLAQGAPQDDAARAALQEGVQSTIQHGLTAVEIGSNYLNWLTLAQIYSNLAGVNVEGALDASRNAYEKAFEARPTNPLPKLRLAQVAVARSDLNAARTYAQEAIALKADFAAAHFLLSQIEATSGNGDAAVTAAAQAVQLTPSDPVGWFNLGYILYSGGAYDTAVSALERAVTLNQTYANAIFILGLSYNALGRTNDAVMAMEAVSNLNPQETWMPKLIANIKAKKDPFLGLQ